MITSIIKSANPNDYTILYKRLFSNAVADLINYDVVAGHNITSQQTDNLAIGPITEINPSDYEPNKYYRWDGGITKYILASEEAPLDNTTYYDTLGIDSLNQYFAHIKELAKIKPTYLALPLDEPTFDIDTNTREITVPKHYQENGISIQGDEIAEIIFFKVDRYFDATDLAMKNIFIQWRTTELDNEGNPIEGVSVPYIIDLESQPGYILFGWPISSKITKVAGVIDFAVRFYSYDKNRDDRKITYSLSTLTQSVNVRPGLDLDISEPAELGDKSTFLQYDDNEDFILTRLVNSDLTGGEPALPPYFIFNLNPYKNYDSESKQARAWLEVDPVTGYRINPLRTYVQAISEDTGVITYSITKLDFDNAMVKDERAETKAVTHMDYLPIEEGEVFNSFVTYYTKVEGENVGDPARYEIFEVNADNWVETTSAIIEGQANEDFVQLYKHVYVIDFKSEGRYFITATNTLGGQSSKQTTSYGLCIGSPTDPIINSEGIHPSYTLGGEIVLLVDVTSSDNITDKDGRELGPKGNKDGFSYQWKKRDITDPTGTVTNISGANLESYTPEAEGYYFVEVTNNLNRTYDTGEIDSRSRTSSIARVTNPAMKPKVQLGDNQQQSVGRAEASHDGITYKVTDVEPANKRRDDNDYSDTIIYKWYKYKRSEGHTVQQDKDDADEGAYVPDENDTFIVQQELSGTNAYTSTYHPVNTQEGDGYYFCVVTNNYNGNESDPTVSAFIDVSDTE